MTSTAPRWFWWIAAACLVILTISGSIALLNAARYMRVEGAGLVVLDRFTGRVCVALIGHDLDCDLAEPARADSARDARESIHPADRYFDSLARKGRQSPRP